MPENLILRINADAAGPHSWQVVDNTGTRIGSTAFGTLADAAKDADQRQLIVLLPADDCLCTHSDMPLRSSQKLLQALPFAFEDQLIGDVAETHFAFGERDSRGVFPVTAVSKTALKNCISKLTAVELNPTRIYAVDATLPVVDDGVCVILENDQAIVRNPNGDAARVDFESLLAAIQMLTPELDPEQEPDAEQTEQSEAQLKLAVYIDDSSGDAGERCIEDVHAAFPEAEFRRLPHGVLSKLATEAIEPRHANLLSGDFAASTDFERRFRPWRHAAVAAALLVAVTITGKAMELSSLKSRLADIEVAQMDIAKKTFPSETRIPSAVGLFRIKMKQAGVSDSADSNFLQFLETISAASKDSPNLSVYRLSYRAGVMDLDLTAPNVQALDSFTNRIGQDANWSASLQSTKAKDNKVEGRLKVERSAQ